MVKGYPDYFGQPQFPYYGQLYSSTGGILVKNYVETPVIDISGQGRTYGGMIWMDSNPLAESAVFRFKIDGKYAYTQTLKGMRNYGILVGSGQPLYLMRYDDVSLSYVVGVRDGITFRYEFQLLFQQFLGVDITVYVSFSYALVE